MRATYLQRQHIELTPCQSHRGPLSGLTIRLEQSRQSLCQVLLLEGLHLCKNRKTNSAFSGCGC